MDNWISLFHGQKQTNKKTQRKGKKEDIDQMTGISFCLSGPHDCQHQWTIFFYPGESTGVTLHPQLHCQPHQKINLVRTMNDVLLEHDESKI